MDVTAIIQARMTSSRLPGKIVKQVGGRPLLALMIERVRQARRIARVIIATTTNREDDVVAALGAELGVPVFRGSERHVLERFSQAAVRYSGEIIMRLTGDCPLIDPDLLDELVAFFGRGEYDYASNCLEPTLPDGLDAEIFTRRALLEAYEEARLPSEIEHVTAFINQRPDRYRLGSWRHGRDLSGLRWTVDEAEDFEFVRQVLEMLPDGRNFRMQDVLTLLAERPELLAINSGFQRNEGLMKSLREDVDFIEAHGKGE